MKKLVQISLTITFLNLFTACAHHRDVRAGADGVHRVMIQTDDTETASRDAISQANHFCKQRGKAAAFVKEEQKYTGDMDEQSYRNAKRAAKVAQTVGGVVHVHGAEKESSLGGLLGLGGIAGDEALGKGYTVDMRFKCM